VPWTHIAKALNLPYDGALPLRTTCPLCKARTLTIYNDSTTSGSWHWCSSCGQRGDMLELAGKVWQTDAFATLIHLHNNGAAVPPQALRREVADRYVREYVTYRKQLQMLWEVASSNLPERMSREGLGGLMRHYHLWAEFDSRRWHDGPGQLFGTMTAREMEQHLYRGHPGMRKQGAQIRFPGSRWRDVLLVPLYNMPGHIRSFVVLGRTGNRLTDELCRRAGLSAQPAFDYSDINPLWKEPGLAFVHTAISSPFVIAVGDWLLALQLQMRHLRSDTQLLPLVAWLYRPPLVTCDWQSLYDRTVIVWASDLTHDVLYEAIRSNARVSIKAPAAPVTENMLLYLRARPTTALISGIKDTAVPWQDALRQWAACHSIGQLYSLVVNTVADGIQPEVLYDALGRKLVVHPGEVHTIGYEGRQLSDYADKWEIINSDGTSVCIANAALRLLREVTDKASGNVYYEGEIRYKGQQLAFIAPRSEVVRDTAGFIRKMMHDASMGDFEVHHDYETRLLEIAMLLNPPEKEKDSLLLIEDTQPPTADP